MKTRIIFRQTVFVIALLITGSSIAQKPGSKNDANNSYALNGPVHNNLNELVSTATPTVGTKITRSFFKYFGDGAEQNWSAVGTDFLNRFHANDVLTNALFDKNGNLIYTITYASEKDMPADIRKIVKSEYFDYTITMAVKVVENKRNIWVVYLDNVNEQITVRVEDGEVEQVQQFEKSN